MTDRRLITLATAVALTLGSGVAFGQNSNTGDTGSMMSIPETVRMLEDNGYTDIDSIDRDLDRYEVDATGPNGQRMELTVGAKTGEVIQRERDDD